MTIIYILLACVILFFVAKFLKKFKIPRSASLTLVSGGVKCGKSTFSVALVRSEFRKRTRAVKIRNFFAKLFKKPLRELPLVYSNVPLAMPYVPLTDDLLLRKKRFVYGSVIYVQEASLVADSQLIRDMDINQRLLLFNKLIGHTTKGGCVIYDTQSVSDTHYSIKRCLSEYFYIHKLIKWVPFVLIAKVQETRYSDDGTIILAQNDDIENHLKTVLISKKNWKYFDCYCYSVLTDELDVEKNIINNDLKTQDLKARHILSFRNNIDKGVQKNEKKDA